MCAMVPATPLVLTEPVTVPSSLKRKLPLPLACVLTGGTSSPPLRLTLWAPLPGIQSGMLEQAASAVAAANIAACKTVRFIGHPPRKSETRWPLEYSHAGHRFFGCAQALPHSRPVPCARRAELRAAIRRL